MDYVFLAGIHGVGKSTLANKINNEYSIFQKSISDLIRQSGKRIEKNQKSTSDIDNNQLLWKETLNNLSIGDKLLILDGHFSLLNEEKKIVPLPFTTFNGTGMKKIILKTEKPEIIQERLRVRDNRIYSIEKIKKFQRVEEERANLYSKISSIPIFIYDNDNCFSNLIKFIEK
ncbi:AAA family ATPase [Enterococcus faecalis]|nr:AAA family ATPase [Enterococcus faecalis]